MQKIVNSMLVQTLGNKNNIPVIFIHGFPLDSSMWSNQINHLKSEYYCVTYDIRGLGESYVGDGQFTMEAYAADLLSIVDTLNLEKPVLCGFSMGGYISLRALQIKPELFSGLILVDTKAEADDDKGKLARASMINQINTQGLDAFIDSFVPPLFSEEAPKEKKKLYKDVINRCKQHNPIGVKGALLAMVSRTNSTPFLKKIKIPAAVISGTQDKITPPVYMRGMADKIKNSEFAITPGSGHLGPLENPGFVNDIIKGFLDRRIKLGSK